MSDSAGSSNTPSLSLRGLRVLSTGLLIASSALFGGLAVALWDRTSLAKLRQPTGPRPHRSLPPDDDSGD